MTIKVETHDASVERPAQVEILNNSGANVEVFVFIGTEFSERHAFEFKQNFVTFPIPASLKGSQRAMVVVQVSKSKLNRMYSVAVSLNGQFVALAEGDLEDGVTDDSGSGLFSVSLL